MRLVRFDRRAILGGRMSRENVAVVRRLLDAMAEDLPTAHSCLDPDLEFIPLRAATEGAYRGHEGFEKFYEDTVESFEIFEPRYELRDLGDQVIAWGTIHLRGRSSGVEMDVTTGGVFDVRDGKITRWEDLGSKENALEAVGLRE